METDSLPNNLSSTSPAAPGISLVIATVERVASLGDLLHSLSAAGLEDLQVIVVDQNTDSRLAPVVARFRDELPLICLRTAVRGANHARNLGARAARYDWVAFPDDDCRYLPDTLQVAWQLIRSNQVAAIVGALVDQQFPSNVESRLRERTCSRRTLLLEPYESALFVRRLSFLAVGGFDERFGPGASFPAAEGTDLVTRLFRAEPAARVCCSPRLRVAHAMKGPPWDADSAARLFNQGIGFGALTAKHPYWHRLLHAVARCARYWLSVHFVYRGWKRESYRRWLNGFAVGLSRYRQINHG